MAELSVPEDRLVGRTTGHVAALTAAEASEILDDQTAEHRVIVLRDSEDRVRGRVDFFAGYAGSYGVKFSALRADGTLGASMEVSDEGDIDIYAFDWTGNAIGSEIEVEQRGRVFNLGGGGVYERGIGTGSQDPNTYTPTADVWHVEITDGPATSGHYRLVLGTTILEVGGFIDYNDNEAAVQAYFDDSGQMTGAVVTGDATSFDIEFPLFETRALTAGVSTLDAGTVTPTATTIGDNLGVIYGPAGSLYLRNDGAGAGELWVKVAEDGGGDDWEKVTTT